MSSVAKPCSSGNTASPTAVTRQLCEGIAVGDPAQIGDAALAQHAERAGRPSPR